MWLINIAFLQLPVREHNCHSGHYHINQFLRHEREARSLCAQEILSLKLYFTPVEGVCAPTP